MGYQWIAIRFRRCVAFVALPLVMSCDNSKAERSDSRASSGQAGAASAGAGGNGVASGGSEGYNSEAIAGAAGSVGVSIQGDGSCASPYLLPGAIDLPRESTVGSGNVVSALSASCLGTESAGPERVYRVQVPAAGNTKLRVKVAPASNGPTDSFDPVVYLTRSCAASTPHPTCLACKDTRGTGSFESLEYVNLSRKLEDVLIVVDGFDFQPRGGEYRLTVSLDNP